MITEPAIGQEWVSPALEAGGIGAWEWDFAAARMRWSAQMFRNLGLFPKPGSESLDLLLSALHPEDRPDAAAKLDEYRLRPGPLRLELRVVWASADVHWIVFLGEVEASPDGPARMHGVTIDSTRRRHLEESAESALRESEARLKELNATLEKLTQFQSRQLDASRAQMQAIFDVSPDWLTLFRATSDGRFIYEDLNRATELAYGKTRQEVIGQPVENVLGTEAAQVPLAHMRACIRTGENQRYTARRTFSGKSRTIDVMFARVPEKYDGDYFIMATARDITEREAIEQQLRQAQKMEAIGQLTGGVAHDFNNLLATIIGNLDLLAPRLATDLRATAFLAAAQRAADNGAKLTAQLLAFSRRQHLQPRAVDLNEAITAMREILARTIGTSIRVETALAPQLWPALVDPTQIEIAILNLAINSRDAMQSGGILTIQTENLTGDCDAAPAEMAGRGCVCVSVHDTGTGMTDDVLRLAVEPFFTTKDVGMGSGLGLSQVYGMVQQSSGHMRIDSTLGIGTAVHLYLPCAEAVDGAAGEAARNPAPDEVPARVLVVDDDPGVRDITVQMLRELGYRVAKFDSGKAVLDAVASGERYDLLVVDIAMPGLSGIETLKRLREQLPAQRALFISGHTDNTGSMPQTGSDPLLRKPFRFGELAESVRRALGQGAAAASAPNATLGK
jgi:PAS domain S-box-containing protein